MQRALPPSAVAAAIVTFAGSFGAGAASAETWTLQAIRDFPTIDAGDVPYYREVGREALAIDATTVAYRDRFARASAPHPGPGGTFDLVLTTLAEVDGETTYHLLVDGDRVGTATNPRVADEFAVRELDFDDIEIPDGATLGVESAAVSNGLVPEDGAFAFARGRWTSLGIATAVPDGPDPDAVGLSVSLGGPGAGMRTGDRSVIDVSVVNADGTAVATSPALLVELPDTLDFVAGEGCIEAGETVRCSLAEIPSGTTTSLALEVGAVAPGRGTVVATVSADQPDGLPADDRGTLDVEVLPVAVAVIDPGSLPGNGEVVENVDVDLGAGTVGGPDDGPDVEPDDGPDGSGGGGGAWWLILLAGVAGLARQTASRRPVRPAL